MARLDTVPRDRNKSRTRGSRIVALNGRPFSSPRRQVELPPGSNQVTLRFNWPRKGTTHANVRFRAQANRRYFVNYDVFPECESELTQVPGWIGEMASTPAGVVMALPLVPAVVASDRLGQAIDRSRHPPQYLDIFVISENQAEGVVHKQRINPDSGPES